MTTMIAAGERGSKAGVADTERETGRSGRKRCRLQEIRQIRRTLVQVMGAFGGVFRTHGLTDMLID